MALVHGEIIKSERKKRKMSQTELAEGICKQATISNIERKNFCKDIEILSKVCRRLDLTLAEVVQSSPEDWLDDRLDEVERLAALSKHDEGLEILEKMSIEGIHDKKIINRYYYNFGNCLLLGKHDFDSALFHFNQVLAVTADEDVYGILANTGIAVTYELKKQYNFAEIYYQKAIDGIEITMRPQPLLLNRVLFNAAKFYSLIEKYAFAVELCDRGIAINKQYASTKLLDFLLYEKAFNLQKLDDNRAIEFYEDAKKIAAFNNNRHVMDTVDKDLKKLK
ncbi:helix-turn-helix domain-containing protein [Enterococcus timonensis]|uniref:helix-turn-helix domain-containing protein n=1 Tax=Enterococcus timonensis TaxID=1852364 RepID=UPI0008D965DB|nr:helix-turn-helix domain-containing protein [Enterococcus timonensis]